MRRALFGLMLLGVSASVAGAVLAAELVGHTQPVYDITNSPDGKWLVTGSFNQSVRLWDATSLQPARTMLVHTGLALTIAVSPDSKLIASGSFDNTIKLWEIPNNSPVLSSIVLAMTAFSQSSKECGVLDRRTPTSDISGQSIVSR